jgi:hypothetical protein
VAALFAWFCRRLYLTQELLAGRRNSAIADLSPGDFVHVAGTVGVLDETLTSKHLRVPCVWYCYGRSEHHGDDDRGYSEERGVDFLLRDDSGEIPVVIKGADFLVDRGVGEDKKLSSGVLNVLGVELKSDVRRVSIRERYLSEGASIRIVGRVAGSAEQRLVMTGAGAPAFVITDKPQSEVAGEVSTKMWAFGVGAGLLLLVGILFFFAPTTITPDPAHLDQGTKPVGRAAFN